MIVWFVERRCSVRLLDWRDAERRGSSRVAIATNGKVMLLLLLAVSMYVCKFP